jgi:hypothetical protein
VQKFIWECGLGLNTIMGYGMVDVVNSMAPAAVADVEESSSVAEDSASEE